MKGERVLDLLGRYLWERRRIWLLLGVFAGIFAVTFALYGLPLGAVLYPGLLCLGVGLPAVGARFVAYCRQHRQRRELLPGIEVRLDALPEGETLAEEDDRALLMALGERSAARLTEYRRREQESMDYYTTWVHQIKTPIAVMRMILQGEDTREHRELSAELFRVEQYVEMVLCYLRLGSDSTDFVFREVALDGVIRRAIRKFAPQFVRKRLALRYEPTQVRVLTDEKWLLFILEQLLSNALKYTPRGEITITVEDRVLKVRDTGMGIAPEDLPRIFERGFTGCNGREDQRATGLGLYLCRQAARHLSLELGAEPTVGVGSLFWVDLNTRDLTVE